ncbi:MAG: magnesium transporter [Anaerolineae bacterium]|nr:magnesium transporter [Anaerolineae bacterium]
MEPRILDDILAHLRDKLEQDDLSGARALIESLRPPDQAELFAELNDADQIALLPELNPTDSADILEELDDQDVAELVAALPTAAIIRIVDEMEPDEAADLIGDMSPVQAQAVLAGLEDPEEIHPLLLHPDDSAGGLMTSDYIALRRLMTAQEAIEVLRAWQPDAEMLYYLFVVDARGKLCGVVGLRHLIVADPQTRIADIMDPDVIAIPAGADQEDAANLMQRYDLLALPVTDADGHLLGVVTIDDAVDVLVDEATEDIQRLGGAQPLGRSYLETPVFTVMRKRIGWLLLLFVTGSLTATVMAQFEGVLNSAIVLSFFVPLLIGTGGNAGSQTTNTIIRALAVGDIDRGDALRALWHEMRVGILIGLGMALVGFLRAVTTPEATPELALVVALAIFAIVIWANGIGAMLPVLATAIGIDPTIVSGPVMSTLVDATGLFIYFTIARLILGL